MSTTHTNREAWTDAASDSGLLKESPSLSPASCAFAAFLMAFSVSLAVLAIFGADSPYMGVSGGSIFVIIALLLFVLDGQAQKAVKSNPKLAPIMNARVFRAVAAVIVATLIGHVLGIVAAAFIIPMM